MPRKDRALAFPAHEPETLPETARVHEDTPVGQTGQRARKVLVSTSEAERDRVDDYPTPHGFVKVLTDFLRERALRPDHSVHEPAAGGGWMVEALRREGYPDVSFADLVHSGTDYLDPEYFPEDTDWVITNPPYRHGEAFVKKALTHARRGVAVLLNSSFIEATGRAKGLFADYPPAYVLVSARKMRLRDNKSSVFAHYWVVWDNAHHGPTELHWVLPEGEITMPSGLAPGVWEGVNK